MKLLHTKEEISDLYNMQRITDDLLSQFNNYHLPNSKYYLSSILSIKAETEGSKNLINEELTRYETFIGEKAIKPKSILYNTPDRIGKITKIYKFTPSGVLIKFDYDEGGFDLINLVELKEL